jgi:hypothetical protein
MKCPQCGSENPPEATRCDCGYDFRSGTLESTTTTEIPQVVGTAAVSFEVQRTGFLRRQKWTVRLAPDSVEFSSLEGGEFVSVPKDQGNARIQFASAFVSGYNVAVRQNSKMYKFKLAREDLSRLRSWMPEKTAADMKTELRNWGIGLILLGIAHFVFSGFLDPVWGAVILVVGVLNLLIPRRGMFIVNGIALLLVGILNITAGEVGSWTAFGILQLVWGVQEIRKFGQYASAE